MLTTEFQQKATSHSEERQVEKKQEFKFIGTGNKKKGQHLFGLNDAGCVYPVRLQTRKDFAVFNKVEKAQHKAVINPNDKFVWAINLKNAKRKLLN